MKGTDAVAVTLALWIFLAAQVVTPGSVADQDTGSFVPQSANLVVLSDIGSLQQSEKFRQQSYRDIGSLGC